MILTHTDDPAEAITRTTALQGWFAAKPDGSGVTVSIGVAQVDAVRLAEAFGQVCDCADAAMYAAKRAGGNTIRIHEEKRAPVDD